MDEDVLLLLFIGHDELLTAVILLSLDNDGDVLLDDGVPRLMPLASFSASSMVEY